MIKKCLMCKEEKQHQAKGYCKQMLSQTINEKSRKKKRRMETNKKWRQNNKDKLRKNALKYYHNNKEKVKKIQKKWQQSERGKLLMRESNKRWREKNPEKFKEMTRKWQQSERGKEYKKFHTIPAQLVFDFFMIYDRNRMWKQQGVEEMSDIYSKTACDLTKREQCDLQEKILIKYKNRRC